MFQQTLMKGYPYYEIHMIEVRGYDTAKEGISEERDTEERLRDMKQTDKKYTLPSWVEERQLILSAFKRIK